MRKSDVCVHLWSATPQPNVSLAEFAYAFSPLVEETAADTVVIDVEGCDLLFGSAYELANEIAKALAKERSRRLGMQGQRGTGCKPRCCHPRREVLQWGYLYCSRRRTHLPRRPAFKILQCSLVGIEGKRATEILETLRLWGVRTFKEFAELPVAGVSERLGQDGLKLQKLASRKNQSSPKTQASRRRYFKNSIELDYPIAELENPVFHSCATAQSDLREPECLCTRHQCHCRWS